MTPLLPPRTPNKARPPHHILLAFTLLAATLPAKSITRAGDWPRFLGPNGNGISAETGLIKEIPTRGLPIPWNIPVGTGYSAPSILGNRLVLHHREKDLEIIECFNKHTGKSLWRQTHPTQYQDPYGYNNGPRAAPILTPDRCYTFGVEGTLTCLELTTGKPVWQRETASEFQVPPAFFGVGSSPLLDGNRLHVMVGGQPNSGMVAFNATTGSTLWENVGQLSWTGLPMLGWPGDRTVTWRLTEKQASYSSPLLATIHGTPHLLCLMRQGLVSLDPETGTPRFSRWFRASVNESVNAVTPIVQDDLIFITAAYYHVGSVLLRVRPDNKTFDEVWKSTALEAHWSTPILHNGFLYAFTGRNEPDARLRCVELKSGRIAWDRDESWPPHSSRQPPVFGRGSLLLADGKLFALGEGGLLAILNPEPGGPRENGRWQVPDLHYPCWAAPVLSDGRLYLRCEDRLICLDARSTKQPDQPPPAP